MIGIIGAMQSEVAELADAMVGAQTIRAAGMDFVSGALEGVPAVVVRSGVGKVNAAVCTQVLADRFGADLVINTGIAGAVAPQVDVGHIVLSGSCLQHDMNAGHIGFQRGLIPFQDCSDFPADPKLLELALRCCAQHLPHVPVHVGRVVTGDLFVANAAQKASLFRHFDALCTEMEGGAVAHAAWLNGMGYLVVRTISDNADAHAVEDYPSFERKAASRSALLVRHMVAGLN